MNINGVWSIPSATDTLYIIKIGHRIRRILMGIVVEKKFVSVERRTMRKKLVYDISDIEPYINWLYFFHAWGLDGKPQAEKDSMRLEAEKFLATWQGRCHTYAVFGIFDANSDGDDLLLGETRIPMLRQQKVLAEGE